ncbi:hypothetical protein [Bacillus sp. NEB1478]|uniref:hypothetical protein n=1 Tax=Bacillus sp. NEB1478 TaxID=3073816 RepID=UPI00287306E8|nr:hypothetical protein [Bacillus sp. NEB1478]WNB93447.1 hypothetical protein RGB74_07190 [Bacillus sp. NEB1478]
MRLSYIYVLGIILFQLTGCFNHSVYREEKDSARFEPREYYRNHVPFSETGFYSSSSLADEMKREITNEDLVKHAIVIKKEKTYFVALQLKAYQVKNGKSLSSQYKKYWEDKWKVPIEITYSPIDYRRAENLLKTKKRA